MNSTPTRADSHTQQKNPLEALEMKFLQGLCVSATQILCDSGGHSVPQRLVHVGLGLHVQMCDDVGRFHRTPPGFGSFSCLTHALRTGVRHGCRGFGSAPRSNQRDGVRYGLWSGHGTRGGSGGGQGAGCLIAVKVEPLVDLPCVNTATHQELLDGTPSKAYNFRNEWEGGTIQIGV